MKIAICDDEVYELEQISHLLKYYQLQKNITLSYDTYQWPDHLLKACENGITYDLLLLDVLMPGVSGIQLAQEIRKYNKCVKIVFLTSSKEYAIESYSVKASGYLTKPINVNLLSELLDDIMLEMEEEQEKYVVIKTFEGISRILLSKIEYCEIYNKTLYIHMLDHSVIEANGSMSHLEQDLCKFPQFYKVHRSYIINVNYVNTVTSEVVEMQSGGKVPIPYRKSNEIKNVILTYLDENQKGV